MSTSVFARVLLLAAASVAASGVRAQPAPLPDPSLASAAVPPLKYTSAFAGYRPFADEAVTPWRQANDTAAGIGGWRAYAREARQPALAPAPVATPATRAAPAAPAASGAHGAQRSP